MEAPKCKICGARHYGLCTPTINSGDRPITIVHAKGSSRLEPGEELTWDALGNPAVKPKFDRNAYHRAYMRDYMRKRRAAAKALKPAEPSGA